MNFIPREERRSLETRSHEREVNVICMVASKSMSHVSTGYEGHDAQGCDAHPGMTMESGPISVRLIDYSLSLVGGSNYVMHN